MMTFTMIAINIVAFFLEQRDPNLSSACSRSGRYLPPLRLTSPPFTSGSC
jgi:hypothetical protein